MASVPKCSTCHRMSAAFVCLCRSLPICMNCIAVHLTSPGTHIPTPVSKVPFALPQRNDLCDQCGRVPPTHFCTCVAPFQKLCDPCGFAHYQTQTEMAHSKHPMSAFEVANRMGSQAFLSKQQLMQQLITALEQNIAKLDQFSTRITSAFNEVIRECEAQREQRLSQLQRLREQLCIQIAEARQVIEMRRYQTVFEATNPIEELILAGEEVTAIELFFGTVDVKSALAALTNFHRSQIESYDNAFCLIKGIPIIKGGSLRLFSLATLKTREIQLQFEPRISERSVYCYISPTTLLSCGGDDHNLTYEINVNTGSVTERQQMTSVRRRPGIFKHENCVYIIGGGNGQENLRSAEKFELREKVWSLTRGSLNQARYLVSLCLSAQQAFITGYGAKSIEVFDVKSELFTVMSLQRDDKYAMPIISDGELLLIQQKSVLQWRIGSGEPSFKKTALADLGSVWSNCPPVYTDSGVFFIRCGSESPDGILKFTITTRTLENVASITF